MDPMAIYQLVNLGAGVLKAGAGLLGAKTAREKQLKEIEEANALRHSTAESINGEGSGGGSEVGHADKINTADYLVPAIGDTVQNGLYQYFDYLQNKPKEEEKVNDSDKIKRPYHKKDTESLDETIDKLPEINVASDDQEGLFHAFGYAQTADPTLRTSNTGYIPGTSVILDRLYGRAKVFSRDPNVFLGRNGLKLIPRK